MKSDNDAMYDMLWLDRVLEGVIRVKVGKDPDKPIIVQGFFEAPWSGESYRTPAPMQGAQNIQDIPVNDRACLIQAADLPAVGESRRLS